MEHRREMGLCSKPNAKRHISKCFSWVAQQHLRMSYALHHHELAWGYPRICTKLCRKMHSAQARDLCEFLQADSFLDM